MTPIAQLLQIMARLRNPDGGCAWDLEQTFATIAPYTIEEAYEVADAITRGDMPDLCEELGDLLLQVVFHAQMADEAGHFSFDDVARGIADKMIRRHPHVFSESASRTAEQQTVAWEAQKAAERAGKTTQAGVLDNIPAALPGMTRAVKLTGRAARVGFDWPSATEVLDKLHEESAEIAEVIASGSDADRLEDEVGDLLFVCANLARKLNVDPEAALRRTNAKFERRFGHIEAQLKARNLTWDDVDLTAMDALWDEAKALERV